MLGQLPGARPGAGGVAGQPSSALAKALGNTLEE
jgi:hypothetical protein